MCRRKKTMITFTTAARAIVVRRVVYGYPIFNRHDPLSVREQGRLQTPEMS